MSDMDNFFSNLPSGVEPAPSLRNTAYCGGMSNSNPNTKHIERALIASGIHAQPYEPASPEEEMAAVVAFLQEIALD